MAACQGCLGCRPDSECILPEDDGHRVGWLLQEADLLVVGSPSYWGNLPAPLKAVFDRNVATLESCLDKPPVPRMTGKTAVAVLACASGPEASRSPGQLPLLEANLRTILEGSGYTVARAVRIDTSWDPKAVGRQLAGLDLGLGHTALPG